MNSTRPYRHWSTLVQVMAWWRQATSHYLSQCWPSPMSPHGVTGPQWVNLSPAETGILRLNKVSTMAADALAPYLDKTSAEVVLTTQDKRIPVFHKERFQLFVPSQTRNDRKCNYTFMFSHKHSEAEGLQVPVVYVHHTHNHTQIAKFMGPTWSPPVSCRPQMGPMLVLWTLLSG